jgi:hypothetical protein
MASATAHIKPNIMVRCHQDALLPLLLERGGPGCSLLDAIHRSHSPKTSTHRRRLSPSRREKTWLEEQRGPAQAKYGCSRLTLLNCGQLRRDPARGICFRHQLAGLRESQVRVARTHDLHSMDYSVRVLLDSGADRQYVSVDLIRKTRMDVDTTRNHPRLVKVANGAYE